MKKKIGINIDGIIRCYLERFEKVYISTFINNPNIVETNEEFTEIKTLTEEEEERKHKNIEDEIKRRIKKPFDSFDLLNHFLFEPGVSYKGAWLDEGENGRELDAQGKLEEFIENKAMSIYGQAEAYQTSVDFLNRLQITGEENNFDVVLLSILKGKAITATYSFLGVNGVRTKELLFLENDFQKWDHCDIVFDIMPETFQTKPEGKVSIKIEHEFNKWDSADYSYPSLRDALKDKKLIEFIKKYCKE